ncbi:MAG: hypothetical protein O2843_02890, partial [Chloroflexi bacterium]|nr:hypothetical protein [Chloroflexota bacterium]
MKADAARNALIGVVAALIGVLLIASGFLVRVVTEPDAAVVAAAAPAGQAAGTTATNASAPGTVDGATLDEVMSVLAEDFVDPDRINKEYLYEAAINGLFQALGDPHSTYIDPDTYAISRDDFSGTFQGIGATVSQQGTFVIIVRPTEGTPADEAG